MASPRRARAVVRVRTFLLLATAAAGCSRSSSASGEVAIATALDPKRPGMQSIYNGVDLAVEDLNARFASRGLRFVQRRGDPEERNEIRIADRFRDDRSVVGVVGHPESGTTMNAIEEYADAKNGGRNALVAISPTGTSPDLTGASRWLFRLAPSDVQSSQAVARFALDSLHATRASIIYRNDAYGKDWARLLAATYRSASGTILQRDPYLAAITPWEAYAAYLKQLRPDVLLFPGSTEDALLALRALRAIGVSLPFVGGDAVSGLEANAAEFPQVRYTAFFVASRAATPVARAFVEAYSRKFAAPPDQRAALAYDAATLIGRAVAAVGADRARVRDYLESIGSGTPAVEGVTGPIEFNAQHDVKSRTIVVKQVGT